MNSEKTGVGYGDLGLSLRRSVAKPSTPYIYSYRFSLVNHNVDFYKNGEIANTPVNT